MRAVPVALTALAVAILPLLLLDISGRARAEGQRGSSTKVIQAVRDHRCTVVWLNPYCGGPAGCHLVSSNCGSGQQYHSWRFVPALHEACVPSPEDWCYRPLPGDPLYTETRCGYVRYYENPNCLGSIVCEVPLSYPACLLGRVTDGGAPRQ